MKAHTTGAQRDGGHAGGRIRSLLIGGLAICAAATMLVAAPALAEPQVPPAPAPLVNTTTDKVTTTSTQDPTTKDVTTKTVRETDSHIQFSGLTADPNNPCPKTGAGPFAQCFGLGFAVGGFFFTEPDIISTTIDGGNVRVLEQHQREASIWLEIHDTFFQPDWLGGMSFGPFVALQLGGTAGTFNSFAAGGMLYFPPSKIFGTTESKLVPGFGLGVGYGWTQIHRLGDGIFENQPLPPGVSTVRFKQTDIGGPVVMLSTTVTF